jgi:hypothetical protein
MSRIDENALRALFEEIEAPPSLDGWRERIADVDAESFESAPHDSEPDDPAVTDEQQDAVVVVLPVGGDLRPKRSRGRSIAVAAAAAAIVGLGGVVVTTQLFDDSPPADPTMIIDGPDRTASSQTRPTTRTTGDSSGQSTSSPPATSGQSNPGGGGPGNQPPGRGTDAPTGQEPPGGQEPTWAAMVGDPTGTNTGVPLGASLSDHNGDLRITTAGQVVSDLRVNGSVIVDAPNVTLKRLLVVAPDGSVAVRQNAGGLTVVDSELYADTSLVQGAAGLSVRRSRFGDITVAGNAELVDNYLAGGNVLVAPGATSVLVRHNNFGRITMNDFEAPIRSVSIENNVLNQVDFPTEAGSAGIHVLGNRFRSNAPSTGWKSSANDYRWSDNTFADSGAPANP